jgi:hypothetical protein
VSLAILNFCGIIDMEENMKYEFIVVDPDTTKLKYKDKEFTIVKDIYLMTKLQNINFTAKTRLMEDLTKAGKTVENFVVKEVKNGKRYENMSNIRRLEYDYILQVSAEVLEEVTKKYTKMGLEELLEDVGITEEKEASEFWSKIKDAIFGTSTPSEKKS